MRPMPGAELHAASRLSGLGRPLIAVLALTAIGFLLRLAGLDQGLFADEASTYKVATDAGSPWDVIDLIRGDQSVVELTPPLSFILAWASAKIGDPTIWVRLPSLLAGALMIPAVYAVGVRTLGRGPALIGAALVALSPFLIFYSQEARSYLPAAFAVVVATLALLIALERRTVWWWAAYAAASTACLYLSYTTALPLLAQFLWVLWARRDAWRPLLASNAIAALLFLPWLGEFFDDGRSPFNFLPSAHPLTLDNVSSDLAHLTIGSPIADLSAVPGTVAWVLIVAGLVVAVVAALRRPAPQPVPVPGSGSGAGLSLLLAMALACPVGMLVWSLLGTTIFDARNLTPSLPYLLLVFGAVLLAPRMPIRALAAGLALAGFGLGALATLRSENERPQVRAAAEFALANLDPGDPVYAVENATYGGLEGPLERYLKPYVPDDDLREAADTPPGTLPSGPERVALISWDADALAGVEVTPTEPALPAGYAELAAETFPGYIELQVRVVGRQP